MADVSNSIQKYITTVITIPKDDVTSAIRSREWFLDRVKGEIKKREKEPILYSEDPILYFGSYFRGTQVSTVDEFDVMLVIDSNNGVFSVNDSAVGHGLGKADPNYKYTQKFYFEDKNSVSPIKILNWQKGIIGTVVESYGGECPERRGQSVTAYIKSKELKIDVVPGGIFKRDEDGKIFYIILFQVGAKVKHGS